MNLTRFCRFSAIRLVVESPILAWDLLRSGPAATVPVRWDLTGVNANRATAIVPNLDTWSSCRRWQAEPDRRPTGDAS
jgi:hypothetical protein